METAVYNSLQFAGQPDGPRASGAVFSARERSVTEIELRRGDHANHRKIGRSDGGTLTATEVVRTAI